MSNAVFEEMVDTISALFKMPPKISVTEWCESRLYLTSLQTDTPGRFSTRLTPYNRAVLEDVKNPDVESETLCYGAQTGKTMTMMAALTWTLVNNPRPCIWVMPNKDLAMAFSETRLQPLFEECEELMERKAPDRHKWKKLQMEFTGALLTLLGSNSPANLASRPAGFLIMDETDKFAVASGREANALELCEMRTRTFNSPKIFKTSTPSILEGPIWREFIAGSMHRYALPCPFCEELFILAFNPGRSALPNTGMEAALRWDPRAKGKDGWDYDMVEKTAHYECPHCKKAVESKHKTKMLREGQWIQTNPNAEPRTISRHLPTFYAPWRKASWGRLAVEFIQATKGLEGLKGFINGTLAEPDVGQWQGSSSGRTERIVSSPEPLAKTVRLMAIDRQIDHNWYVIREFVVKGGDSRLVAFGRADTTDELEEIRQQQKVNPDCVGYDSGYEPSTVYQECSRFGWFALRGEDKESWPIKDEKDPRKTKYFVPYHIVQRDPFVGTSRQGVKKVSELHWSNPTIKDILARLRNSENAPVNWEVPAELVEGKEGEEYWRHLDGEYKDRDFNRKTGQVVHIWKKKSRHWPNHMLDCELMIIAVALKTKILKLKADE